MDTPVVLRVLVEQGAVQSDQLDATCTARTQYPMDEVEVQNSKVCTLYSSLDDAHLPHVGN